MEVSRSRPLASDAERVSPPEMIVFSVEGRRPARHSSERTDGVLASRVTPDSRSAIASALGMTRTVPPTVSGPSTSRTNGSKLNEMEVAVTASSSGLKVACTHSNTLVKLSWATSTAFGRPDDPEVKRRYAAASGAGSTRWLTSVASARVAAEDRGGIEHGERCVEAVRTAGRSDDHRDADPFAHGAQPGGGVLGVEGHVRCTCPPDPEHGGNGLLRAGQAHPDPLPRTDAARL